MTTDALLMRLRRLPPEVRRWCDALCQRTCDRAEAYPRCSACGRRHVEAVPAGGEEQAS